MCYNMSVDTPKRQIPQVALQSGPNNIQNCRHLQKMRYGQADDQTSTGTLSQKSQGEFYL